MTDYEKMLELANRTRDILNDLSDEFEDLNDTQSVPVANAAGDSRFALEQALALVDNATVKMASDRQVIQRKIDELKKTL